MKQLLSSSFTIALLITSAFQSAFANNDTVLELEGRMVVRQLAESIKEDVAYDKEELAKRPEAFRELYKKQMEPRLKELPLHIDPGAMQWVDIDWDDEPELILWTEGLSISNIPLKEHLYVIKLNENRDGYIMKSHPLKPQPTRQGSHYRYSRFWSLPNKDRDLNAELRALLTYGSFGEINAAYTNLEIMWLPNKQKVVVKEFRSHFPVAVEGKSADIF